VFVRRSRDRRPLPESVTHHRRKLGPGPRQRQRWHDRTQNSEGRSAMLLWPEPRTNQSESGNRHFLSMKAGSARSRIYHIGLTLDGLKKGDRLWTCSFSRPDTKFCICLRA
jgi:hypothetical protein